MIPYRLQIKLKNQLCHTETLKSKFHLNQGDDGSPTVHHDDSDSSDGENNGQSRSNYLTYLQGQMRESGHGCEDGWQVAKLIVRQGELLEILEAAKVARKRLDAILRHTQCRDRRDAA